MAQKTITAKELREALANVPDDTIVVFDDFREDNYRYDRGQCAEYIGLVKGELGRFHGKLVGGFDCRQDGKDEVFWVGLPED